MSRYYYLLCLFLIIKWTFCYDYINPENGLKYKYEQRPFRKDRVHRQRVSFEAKHNAHRKRPEYEVVDDKEPISQIDVASFIRKPDEYALDDNYEIDGKPKSKSKLKNYDDYGAISGTNAVEEGKKSDKPLDYVNSAAENPQELNSHLPSLKDPMNPQLFNIDTMQFHGVDKLKNTRRSEDKLSNSNQVPELVNTDTVLHHNTGRKDGRSTPNCFKRLRIPFFSSNKNDSTKLKKDKRKIFGFHKPKKWNKNKESPTESLFKTKEKANKDNPNSLTDSLNEDNRENSFITREKRQDWTDVRERQLKELEEVQRKVDSVRISPTYEKNS